MTYHLPTPLSLTAHDFDTYSRAHTRISEAIEALAQCRLSFCDFGGDFEAYAAAHTERTSTMYRLHDAQAYAAAWAKHALGQLDAAVSCVTQPPSPNTPLPVSLH